MQEIFAELALTRLFEGQAVYWRRNGKPIYVKVWPPVIASAAELVEPERDGVLRGRAWVDGRPAKRSRFFPYGWTRERIEAAIIEAYGTRKPDGHRGDGWFWGKGGGLLIWLFLNEEGQILYVQPTSRIHIRRRRDTRGCEQCKRVLDLEGHCPIGHDFVPAWLICAWRLYKKARRKWKLRLC